MWDRPEAIINNLFAGNLSLRRINLPFPLPIREFLFFLETVALGLNKNSKLYRRRLDRLLKARKILL